MHPASFRAHAAVPFMNPMSERDLDASVAVLDLAPGARVVETGCGAAEVLLRILEAHPGATGTGVDPDPHILGRARDAAARRVPGREPELVQAPAQDAALAPGAFDLVVNVAASHAHGGFPGALAELAALARPDGGLVLLGEGYWTRAPSEAFLAALGGASADELPIGLPGLLDAARAAGLEPVDTREATVVLPGRPRPPARGDLPGRARGRDRRCLRLRQLGPARSPGGADRRVRRSERLFRICVRAERREAPRSGRALSERRSQSAGVAGAA